MLRVSYSYTAIGQRFTLYGRLSGPWVEELRLCWWQARQRAPLARAVVDLNEVTFIDKTGEILLREMLSAGAELIATGVFTKHLLESFRNHELGELRRGLEDLITPSSGLESPQNGDK